MSRLYTISKSDSRQTLISSRGHYWIWHKILWGSKHHPKMAIRIHVEWGKDKDKPIIYIDKVKDLEYHIHTIEGEI